MAQYIGFVQGNRGQASRLGSKKSGMDATAKGWQIGGTVMIRWNEKKKRDEITVQLHGGSNGGVDQTLHLGTFYRKDRAIVKETAAA